MKKYKYKLCSKCKEEKTENRNPYCIKCSRDYVKELKNKKSIESHINLEELKEFIRVVNLHNKYSIINVADINNIILYYQNITNIKEYDIYKGVKQINLMWSTIVEYYEKEVKKINI